MLTYSSPLVEYLYKYLTKEDQKMIKKWITQRLKERTTLDGAVLIGAGVAFLIFKPIASIVAYGAIAYGAWTMFKKES
jgi:hypothetical protein